MIIIKCMNVQRHLIYFTDSALQMLKQLVPYRCSPPRERVFLFALFFFYLTCKKQIPDLLVHFIYATGRMCMSKYSYKGELLTLNSEEYLFTGK